MDKVNLTFHNDMRCELTPMQSTILYRLVVNTVSETYGSERVEQIVDAFNGDTLGILKCGISLIASEVRDEN